MKKLSPGQKAKQTSIWAKTMTKWLVTFASREGKKWQLVSFEGVHGGESTGIVDFLAIRKDHTRMQPPLKRGDCFEIVLVQAKGGGATWPSVEDIVRLRMVGARYHAKAIILANWQKGKSPTLYRLRGKNWVECAVREVF